MKSINIKIPILFLTLLFQNCIPYLYHVSTEQAKIILNRKEIPQVIESEKEEEITKSKLKLIQKVREFSVKECKGNERKIRRSLERIWYDCRRSEKMLRRIRYIIEWFQLNGKK